MKSIKVFFVRLWEAMRMFWNELSEKRFIPVEVQSEISNNRLIAHFNEGDPFSNTNFVMLQQKVVFEPDIILKTYNITKIRKSNTGIRFDLKNPFTGEVARRVHINKLRGITDIEYQIVKESL